MSFGRRWHQIVLPVVLFALVILGAAGVLEHKIYQEYRVAANTEMTALITRASASSQPTEEYLRQIGVLEGEFVLQSAKQFAGQTCILAGLSATLLIAMVLNYFCWMHWQSQRRLGQLIRYLKDLENRIYALRPAENREDDFSLLTNEIYKLAVLLQEAAESNRKTRKQLEVALADISHQLRTPLTSLQVVLDNLSDYSDMPPELRQEFLHNASRQVETMSDLVTTLLNLAKFDNGTIVPHPAKIKLGHLLEAACEKVAILAELQDVEIEVYGTVNATMRLDLRWQAEAVANILKNCIEHSPEGSKLEIEAVDTQVFSRLVIRDHGDGIAAAELPHIFERFYRAQNAVSGSVGIGLAFAKAIIEVENGSISVKSYVGQGTEFIITYFK